MSLAAFAAPHTLDLARDQAVTFAGDGCLQLVSGRAWITATGDARDAFLVAGDEWCLSGQSVVVSALSTSRLRLAPARPSLPAQVRRGWRGLTAAVHRQVRQWQLGIAEGSPWQ